MDFVLPHPSDAPSVWRSISAQFAGDSLARDALLAAADAGSDAIAHAVWPALIARTRGSAHLATIRAIAERAQTRRPGPGVVWALMSALLGPRDEARTPAARALSKPAFARDREGIALALAIAGRASNARGATAREKSALDAWTREGGEDPLADRDAQQSFRAWVQGRERPAMIDYALVLACAGARRAELEHLRAVAEHLVTLFNTATPECAALWRWLATGGSDGGEDDGAGRSSWLDHGPRVAALGALSTVAPSVALAHLAPHAEAGAPFDRAVLAQVLRACAHEHLRAQREAESSSWVLLAARAQDRIDEQRATDAAIERLCDALSRSSADASELWRVLLGRERDDGPAKHRPVCEPWLSPAMRVRALSVALSNASLGARAIALGELGERGVVPGVLALLREIARSDPDPITRQQARQLARPALP